MKRINPLLLFCFIIQTQYSIFSQSKYSDYSSAEKSIIFFDDFVDNRNGWSVYNKTNKRKEIKNGYLYFESKESKGKTTMKPVNILQSKNFEIETKIKFISGIKGKSQELVWGADEDRSSYRYYFSGTGSYKIAKYVGKYIGYIDYIPSDLVNKTGYNKLTIRKVNQTYYYFFNEQLVHTMDFEPFFGNKIGVHVSANSVIHVDYIKVSYLEKISQNNAPEIVITEPNIDRGFKVVKQETVRVAGRAIDSDGVYAVTANGRKANLQTGGYFSVNVPLAAGENTITVKATDVKMISSTKSFTVKRESESVTNVNEKRVALIIGNSNYSGAANLGENPINDANDISATLKSLGFTVITKTNANLTTMNNALREFGRQNRDADVALFFFAGHGMQVEKTNYLLPVGIDIKDKKDVSFECVSVSTVQKIMETSNADRLNLIILDACRNNPFRTWQRGGATGLADMAAPSGTLIAFATSPGATAANGAGRNGLYTGELIKQLKKPQRIEDVFINTRVEVEKKSGGNQSPWELARLRGVYYLKK